MSYRTPWMAFYFYPRSPRGERRGAIHYLGTKRADFYPRSPRGERHDKVDLQALPENISIHAPREGSDRSGPGPPPGRYYFYPRSPRGERLSEREQGIIQELFLSTLPARGATANIDLYGLYGDISIHAPREGSDAKTPRPTSWPSHFYPRSPRGERRWQTRSG